MIESKLNGSSPNWGSKEIELLTVCCNQINSFFKLFTLPVGLWKVYLIWYVTSKKPNPTKPNLDTKDQDIAFKLPLFI